MTSYRQLVIALADGDDVDPARAEAILLDSAKSPAQLAADVLELKSRRSDAEAVKPLARLKAEQHELAKRQISLRQWLRDAEQQFRVDQEQLLEKIGENRNKLMVAEAAEQRLKAGRSDPREAGLRSEQSGLLMRRSELLSTLGNIETVGRNGCGLLDRLDKLRKALKAGPQPRYYDLEGSPSIVGPTYDKAQIQLAIDAAELHVRNTQSQLKGVEKRLEEIAGALAEIERLQLTP